MNISAIWEWDVDEYDELYELQKLEIKPDFPKYIDIDGDLDDKNNW